jgi:hypothetical protein
MEDTNTSNFGDDKNETLKMKFGRNFFDDNTRDPALSDDVAANDETEIREHAGDSSQLVPYGLLTRSVTVNWV